MTITKDLVGWNSYPTGPLRSGPMLGQTGENDARVWAQARDSSPLTLRVYPPAANPVTYVATPTAAHGLCVSFHVTGLVPGVEYGYDISSPHGTTPRYHLKAGLADSARRVRIAFGSCFRDYDNNGLAVFDSIAAEHADVFLMTGDNAYFLNSSDWQDENGKMLAHLRHRNNDALRKLIPNISVLGIWDDHDFGPNDSDSSNAGKSDSLSAFKHVWAQSRYGLPEQNIPGIFSRVRCGPVEVFLLDGRAHRVERHHILGPDQLNWLKTGLQSSTAAVKLIVSGSVVLPNFVTTMEDSTWEGWRRDAPAELDALLAHIEGHDVRGVVFVSGDLHLSYLMHQRGTRLPNGQRGPEYWEVISSPLANNAWSTRVKVGPNPPTYDPCLVEEVVGHSYGLIDVDLDRAGREVSLHLKNDHGATCASRQVSLGSLRVRPAGKKKMTAVVWPNGKAYFFRGGAYVRYTMNPEHEGVDDGYPKPIHGNWPRLGEAIADGLDGIDAAVVWPNNGKAYFFAASGYVRYTVDPAKEGADDGYPRYISSNWPGLWSDGIDAAVAWPNGKVYFFKGREYVRYNPDPLHEGVEAGYPKPIEGNWKGLAEAFPDGIDAAIVWPNGKAYFFKGAQYVRYTIDPAHEGVDSGYPKPIEGNWKGLGSF